MKQACLLIIIALLLSISSSTAGNTIPDRFFAPQMYDVKISPDGEAVSYLGRTDNNVNLFVRTSGDTVDRQITDFTHGHIADYFWSDSEELIIVKDDSGNGRYKLYQAETDDDEADIILDSDFECANTPCISFSVDENIIMQLKPINGKAANLYKLDFDGDEYLIKENPGNAKYWICDESGDPIAWLESENEGLVLKSYSDNKTTSFTAEQGFRPIGPAQDGTFPAIWFNGNIRQLINFSVRKMQVTDTICNDLLHIYKHRGRPYAYAYSDRGMKIGYMDNRLAKISNSLEGILTRPYIIRSYDDDLERLIIERLPASGRPEWYLCNNGNNIIRQINRTDTNKYSLTKHMAISGRKGEKIDAYITYPLGTTRGSGNPTIIYMPHSNGYDFELFNEEVQLLAASGFMVIRLPGENYLGPRLHDKASDILYNLARKGYAHAKQFGIMGSGNGANAALHCVKRNPTLYSYASLLSPVGRITPEQNSREPMFNPIPFKVFHATGFSAADLSSMRDFAVSMDPSNNVFRLKGTGIYLENEVRRKDYYKLLMSFLDSYVR